MAHHIMGKMMGKMGEAKQEMHNMISGGVDELKEIKQLFLEQNQKLNEVIEKLAEEEKVSYTPWKPVTQSEHDHHDDDHHHHDDHHDDHDHDDHHDDHAHAEHHDEGDDMTDHDHSDHHDDHDHSVHHDDHAHADHHDDHGHETSGKKSWWEENKHKYMDKMKSWKSKMGDTGKDWWEENKHKFMDENGDWDKSKWNASGIKEEMHKVGITDHGGMGWEDKLAAKWEFMGKMKEEFSGVDWSSVMDNMPWEMIRTKLDEMSSPDYKPVDWKAKKQEMKHSMFKTSLAANRAEMSSFFLEASQRNTVDQLAKVTKELPRGTTCTNMAWGLSCLMEQQLEASAYDPKALKPHSFIEQLYATGILFPEGPGHQSVAYMPNASEAVGSPVVATLVHSRYAITSGIACLSAMEEWIEPWSKYLDLEKVKDMFHWDVEKKNFLKHNPVHAISGLKPERLAIQLHGKNYHPSGKWMIPNSKHHFDVDTHFANLNSMDEFVPAMWEFAEHAMCVLAFDDDLPAWPACNPIDDGQMGKKMVEIKYELADTVGHKLGNKPDMEVDQIVMLTNAFESIVKKQYWDSVAEMEYKCLYEVPRQCFAVCYCDEKAKTYAKPIDLMPWDDCLATYGEERCTSEYFATLEGKPDMEGKKMTHGAPLLCVENGSVAYRGTLKSVNEEGVMNFATADYNILAMAALEKDFEYQLPVHEH